MPNQYTGGAPTIAGQRFGRLTIIGDDPDWIPGQRRRWVCQCDCGTTKILAAQKVKTGNTRSCGCLRREATAAKNTTHGLTERIPEYDVWLGIRKRCLNPAASSYRHYGGRGITICPEWASFERFYADMGARPSAEHSIDRINNDGPYSAENCRWATVKEQSNNRRSNRWATYNGVTLRLAEWADRLGIGYSALDRRIKRGWPEDMVFSPQRRPRPHL